MKLTAVYRPVPEGGFVASVKEIPGALSQGETLEEARANLLDAVNLLIETASIMAEEEMAGEPVIYEPLLIGEAA
ncbi:MAG: type II toxin-antitoxin system HicB family antitoxin [Gemmatimonadetes bacterium]|nr:type II toxin-antitoxin system HicB family antitoxin [Gemmatimonadota bacterium]